MTNGPSPAAATAAAVMTAAVALSVRHPWAELLLTGIKDVENRSWPTAYRGPLLVHAGRRIDQDAVAALGAAGLRLPTAFVTGAVLGAVDLVACVQGHPSRWAAPGDWHWVVANPIRFPRPVRFPGQRKLFRVPAAVLPVRLSDLYLKLPP